ncbi:MAG TPA: response regulator transcription factor [Arachnia sp.]|nr:response regulator transcription factor [Arachnia sp.]HMT84996.1 response regulator transcription factor [Arachnia sp.]
MGDLRVAVVDDDPVLLAELPELLALHGVEVIWVATGAGEAADFLSRRDQLPDVLVVDVNMPVMSGYEFALRVGGLHPELPVVMYTSIDTGASLRDALDCGARGYLVKHDPPARMALLLRLAATGQLVFSESPGRRLTEDFADHAPSVDQLTPRQYEVLRLASQGCSNELVAKRLGCSIETVKKHFTAIFVRLDARDRASAVAKAIRVGIL